MQAVPMISVWVIILIIISILVFGSGMLALVAFVISKVIGKPLEHPRRSFDDARHPGYPPQSRPASGVGFLLAFGALGLLALAAGLFVFGVKSGSMEVAPQPTWQPPLPPAGATEVITQDGPQIIVSVQPESALSNAVSPDASSENPLDPAASFAVKPTVQLTKFDTSGYEIQATSQSQVSDIPDWAAHAQPLVHVQDEMHGVLVSERFASPEEAESQLVDQLSPVLKSYLHERYPALLNTDPGWKPKYLELCRVGAIKQQCVATYPLEIGQFVEPVYQVSWQVELSSSVRDRLYASWRPQILDNRLLVLSGALAGASTLMGLGAFIARKRS